MILGFYGGSFDPPHVCHALACHYVLATGQADRILLVPCCVHPFAKHLTPLEDRLEMCRRAVAHLDEAVEVSDIESRLATPNYTVDTLRALQRERPDDTLRLIVGSDILDEAARWKEFDEVRRLAPLVVVPRGLMPGAPDSTFALPPLSSTAVRAAYQEGGDISALVSRGVLDWIRQRGLYR